MRRGYQAFRQSRDPMKEARGKMVSRRLRYSKIPSILFVFRDIFLYSPYIKLFTTKQRA